MGRGELLVIVTNTSIITSSLQKIRRESIKRWVPNHALQIKLVAFNFLTCIVNIFTSSL